MFDNDIASENTDETMLDLFNDPALQVEVNDEEINRVKKADNVPDGWYLSQPPLTPGKKVTDGRPSFFFSGKGTHQVTAKEDRIFFTVSPVPKFFAEDHKMAGRPYGDSKLYGDAVAVYKKTTGKETATAAEVLKHLADYPVLVRMGGGFVRALAAPKV